MLTAREWVWMFASTVLAASFVTIVMFSLCHWLGSDCRIDWGRQHEIARAKS